MNQKITSMWQDYETHLFTCENCKTQTLGEDLIHDFEASELVLPLDCPNCKRRLALLNIKASPDEIKAFAAQGYKTAIDHLAENDRYYETWPDFTAGENEEKAASRIAYSIELNADPQLGSEAIKFMTMVAWGITMANHESPYIVESVIDENEYFQVIRGSNGEYYSELSSPEALDRESNQEQQQILEELGWTLPNEDSPNYHREYESNADTYQIAYEATMGWFKAFKRTI